MRLWSSLAGLAAAALVLTACNTIDSRIGRQQALFDSYPPNVQQNIRNGVIEVGYTPEMVVMALGEPVAVLAAGQLTSLSAQVSDAIFWAGRVPGFAENLSVAGSRARADADLYGICTGVY